MRVTLSNATPVVCEIFNDGPLTVAVYPNASSTVNVEFSVSSEDDVKAGTALWQLWAKGAATAPMADDFPSPISALRLTAAAGSGTVEVLGLRNEK